MIFTAIVSVGFAINSLEKKDTDYPHRDWGQIATLNMTPAEAAACIARQLSRDNDRVLPIAVDGGIDIDAGPEGFFGVVNEPWERYQVRSENGQTTLRVFYRHPANRRNISRVVRRMGTRCLKVIEVKPTE